jgi:hypothetical protein
MMMKLTFSLAVALYAGFVIWGQPGQAVSEAAKSASAPIAVAAADFDRPTILTPGGDAAEVTRAVARDVIVPDPAVIAASAPAPSDDFGRPRDIGEPMIVSLVDPGTQAPASAADDARNDLLVVTGSRVNLRAGPSTANAVVDSLAEGTLTEPLGAPVNGWQEIRDVESGLTGYMAARFLSPA